MRRTFLNLSLLALLAAPLAAHAATYDLTFSGPGVTYDYIVPSPGSTFSTDGSLFIEFSKIQFITKLGAGAPTTAIDTVDFLSTLAGGGVFDPTGLNIADHNSTQLFTLFSASTGFISSAPDTFTDVAGTTLTYSAKLVGTAAPEPSSLMLLGTGALGLAGSFRRRLFA